MSLIRRIARPLIAAPFVYEGVRTVKDPRRSTESAQKTFSILDDFLRKNNIPVSSETVVRASAGASVGAALLYATNRAPRVAALTLLATTNIGLAGRKGALSKLSGPERSEEIRGILTDAALLGAVLLAAVDRDGRPSLGYRMNKMVERGQKTAQKKQKEIEKFANESKRAVENSLGL